MTRVCLVCDSCGRFRRVSAEGHAGFAAKGKDIVCAAETSLLRTALAFLENTGGILVRTGQSGRGSLSFSAEHGTEPLEAAVSERLRAGADFLRIGLGDLAHEYPRCIEFCERTEN
ncbi:MAG: ribosomal-processing cysteine protease Prp [Treponema sp.]|nr:ribosomal-processing cysteine protease Prp [Treponema sp.]